MNFFGNFNMFMNNGLNFTPFSSYSFNNFSFFNFPSFNFSSFSNFWGAGNFNNNISIFNNFSNPAFNNCWNSFSFGDTFTYSASATGATTGNSSSSSSSSSSGSKVLEKAMSYVGRVNSDAEGVRLFSPAGSSSTRPWCCDFATYCASKALGSKYPKSMITGGNFKLRERAKEHNCWVDKWSSSAKPGDIVLVNDCQHAVIIKSIDGNGKFTCVSGNYSDAVKVHSYSTSAVVGFVSMDKLA